MRPIPGRRFVWAGLLGLGFPMPRPVEAAIPPHVVEVSPGNGSTGVSTSTTLVVRGSGTWSEGSWVTLALIEAATGTEVPVEPVSATWGRHTPPVDQPPGHVGGGSYTDTVLTYKPRAPLRPGTLYILRWRNPPPEPAESRFTTAPGPAGKPSSATPPTSSREGKEAAVLRMLDEWATAYVTHDSPRPPAGKASSSGSRTCASCGGAGGSSSTGTSRSRQHHDSGPRERTD